MAEYIFKTANKFPINHVCILYIHQVKSADKIVKIP